MSDDRQKQMVEDKLQSVFSELGQRNSTPRRIMIEELTQLAASREGFTANELWQRLRKSDESIGRATIFRAMRQLVEKLVLDCIDFSDGTRLYRVCGGRILDSGQHHHHLACNICHRIIDFHFCLPKDELDRIGENENFLIEGHSLTIYGVCQNCRRAAQDRGQGDAGIKQERPRESR
jgi:Fe2+ or Zn2+ uptake regulation protein